MGSPGIKLQRQGFFPRGVFPDNDRPKAQKSPGLDNESNVIPEGQKPGGGKKEPGEYYIYDNC